MTNCRRCDTLSKRTSRSQRKLRRKREKSINHKVYNVSNCSVKEAKKKKGLALIDGGANGGLWGPDMRVLEESDRKVNVTGISFHQIPGKTIVCCAAVSSNSNGEEVLCIYHEYADTPEQKTSIHSCTQLRAYNVEINDISVLAGGMQYIKTANRIFPLIFENGLCYLPQCYPTDEDMRTLKQEIMTSDAVWDPTIFDTPFTLDEFIKNLPVTSSVTNALYDDEGNLSLAAKTAPTSEEGFIVTVNKQDEAPARSPSKDSLILTIFGDLGQVASITHVYFSACNELPIFDVNRNMSPSTGAHTNYQVKT